MFAAAAMVLAGGLSAVQAGPVETNIFAVQGVPVDVTSTDAAAAKNQALMDVQVKAFFILVERLGSAQIAGDLAKLKPGDIAPYLKSLSIEQESSAPGRYIGTFTVRFMPDKITKLLTGYGIRVPTQQASPIIVLPVYRDATVSQLWEDNIWRKAWLDLHAEQLLVPLIVPLGDLEDTGTMSVEDALAADPIRLEALRRRYGAQSLLIAIAEPAEGGGLHVMISGETMLGKVTFDKVYQGEDKTLPGAATAAVQRVYSALTTKYKDDEAKLAANGGGIVSQSISVSVPFASPTQWNGIRSRILATPSVTGVDVSSLEVNGAVIRLAYTSSLELLQQNLQRTGLSLSQVGVNWVIQPL